MNTTPGETGGGASGESFPELDAFLAEQAARHQRLVRRVFVGSLALLAAGIAVFVYADTDQRVGYVAAGLLLIGFGVLGLIRAAVSKFTDVDTRARDDLWVGVAPPLDDEDDEARGG